MSGRCYVLGIGRARAPAVFAVVAVILGIMVLALVLLLAQSLLERIGEEVQRTPDSQGSSRGALGLFRIVGKSLLFGS